MFNKYSKSHSIAKTSNGFTLIEMLMVILIIAVTSKIVAVSFEDIGFSARFEQTDDRINTIRQAIVGNPKRTINGQPDISGFVADMGRLPINIRELISNGPFCYAAAYGNDVSDDGSSMHAIVNAAFENGVLRNVCSHKSNNQQ